MIGMATLLVSDQLCQDAEVVPGIGNKIDERAERELPNDNRVIVPTRAYADSGGKEISRPLTFTPRESLSGHWGPGLTELFILGSSRPLAAGSRD
jgi:hypothetical protein